MMTKGEFEEIKARWARGTAFFSAVIDGLIEVAQAYFDTADFVAISKAEYDWLVERSHRLEGLEL